ncbi:SPOR domain-containing protein, partial [Bacteroidota bacterium]
IKEETRLIEQPAVPATTIQNGLYRNIPNESQVRGLIFTDGSKYFVQVSSWRNTGKAESEVRRLRGLGYEAFIVEAYIPKFKSTWYRVKIGDFNSVTEAEQFQQNKKF